MRKMFAAAAAALIFLSGCAAESNEIPEGSRELMQELVQELSEQEKLEVILSSDEYPEAMAEMALGNAETIDYVYNFPLLQGRVFDADLSEEASMGAVPLLMQWDKRWGYMMYGTSPLGLSGCGPTCLSMAAVYLLQDPSMDPATVAQFALENDYRIPGNGTSWGLMSDGCRKLGLSSRELPLDEQVMKDALDDGEPIIAVLGKGDFTDSGHYIVITGYGTDGFSVNDPNSAERSGKTWSYRRLSGQINNMWAMTRA